MQHCFSGKTSDIVWRMAMNKLLSNDALSLESRLGKVVELSHISLNIDDPRQRWVVSRRPFINPAFAIAEVFAILAGSNDAKFLNFWNPALPKYAGYTSKYYGAYGYRLRKAFGFDQIDQAYKALSSNIFSRQVMLQIWNPGSDLPESNGVPRADDIPCNICSSLKVREGKLDWLQVMRSNDLYRGTPYNFVQFTTLQEIFAGWLGLEVGKYCQVADSLHLYKKDIAEIDQTCLDEGSINCMNCDDLRLDKTSWEKVFAEAYKDMKKLSEKSLTRNSFKEIYKKNNLPEGYSNLLLIAAADCARRHGWYNEVNDVIGCCGNELLVFLWNGWEKRMKSALF